MIRPFLPLLNAVVLGIAAALVAGKALAADAVLRGDIVAARDTLTVRDLIDGAPTALADTALFRAPMLGQTGTIQVRRIVSAANALGLQVQTGGRHQVTITRASRQIGPAEIETAVKKRLAHEAGLDGAATALAFDGQPPVLAASPEVTDEPVASELSFDRRTRRFSAAVWLGPATSERRAQTRVSGSVVDLVEVIVAGKAMERGQTVQPGDLLVERRPRDLLTQDAAHDGATLEGRVLRRAVMAGALLRPADLARPELVGRGDMVTATYEGAGLALSLRVKSNDAGSMGDTVTVVNPQSKKVLNAVVTGPGRVRVGTPAPGRIAAAEPARTTP